MSERRYGWGQERDVSYRKALLMFITVDIGMEAAHPVRGLSFLGGNGPCSPQVHKAHMSDPSLRSRGFFVFCVFPSNGDRCKPRM